MTVLYLRRGDITTNNRVDKYRSIRGIIGMVYAFLSILKNKIQIETSKAKVQVKL